MNCKNKIDFIKHIRALQSAATAVRLTPVHDATRLNLFTIDATATAIIGLKECKDLVEAIMAYGVREHLKEQALQAGFKVEDIR
jgi:hypothetical protein